MVLASGGNDRGRDTFSDAVGIVQTAWGEWDYILFLDTKLRQNNRREFMARQFKLPLLFSYFPVGLPAVDALCVLLHWRPCGAPGKESLPGIRRIRYATSERVGDSIYRVLCIAL
jgi:hypothetical protein